MEKFANLPKSAMENLEGIGRKMEAIKDEMRQLLKVKDDAKLTITHQWDGSVLVYVDGFFKGRFYPKVSR